MKPGDDVFVGKHVAEIVKVEGELATIKALTGPMHDLTYDVPLNKLKPRTCYICDPDNPNASEDGCSACEKDWQNYYQEVYVSILGDPPELVDAEVSSDNETEDAS